MIDLKDFEEDLRLQNLADRTVQEYIYVLRNLPKTPRDQKSYLSKHKDSRMLIFAYRKYLTYQRKKGLISSDQLLSQLDTFKPPKRRGSIQNGNWFPYDEWEDLVANAPHRCAKMGIWLAFQFGLRLGELINLRIEDIDLDTNYIHLQVRKDWHPKHFHNRSIPITPEQKETLKRWINERPTLKHPYVIYTTRNNQVTERTFQMWCKKAHPELKPHDLRRSFAKVLYYKTKKDLKLVQMLLGHSNIATTSQYLGLDTEEIHDKFVKAFG